MDLGKTPLANYTKNYLALNIIHFTYIIVKIVI